MVILLVILQYTFQEALGEPIRWSQDAIKEPSFLHFCLRLILRRGRRIAIYSVACHYSQTFNNTLHRYYNDSVDVDLATAELVMSERFVKAHEVTSLL